MTILREGVLLIGAAVLVLYAIVMIFKKVKPVKFFLNLSFWALCGYGCSRLLFSHQVRR